MAALTTTLNKKTFTGDGIVKAHNFPYLFYADGDLNVYLNDTTSTDAPVLQTISTQYTVSGAGESSGGVVTMVTAATATEEVIVERVVGNTQDSEYKNYNRFPAPTVEKNLNRLTMMVQQLTEKVGRKLGFNIGSSGVGDIPDPIADTLIGFDSAGTAIELKTITSAGDLVFPATGLIAADGTTTPLGRTLTAIGTAVITNGNGLSGNPTIDVSPLDTLIALANINDVTWSCTSATQVVIDSGSVFKGVDSGESFTFTSNRTFDVTATAGDLGALNTGVEASDKWYYLIALGDTTGVTAPHIIGVERSVYTSFTTADLTGNYAVYDDYKRIGAIRNNAFSDLSQGHFYKNTFYSDQPKTGTINSTSSTSYVDADYTIYAPPFARKAQLGLSNSSTALHSVRVKGAGGGQDLAVAATLSTEFIDVLLNASQIIEFKTSAGTLFAYLYSYFDDLSQEDNG